MTPARLHWVWRALIAAAVAFGVNIATNMSLSRFLTSATFGFWPFYIVISALRLIVPIAAYGLLTHWLGPKRSVDQETRCRRCAYILRGISEPRCPECGERI